MHPLLSAAIVELYAASQARQPSHIEGSPCCISPEELAELVEASLRALTPAQLYRYGSSALSTVGSVDDFRYYWPRLAELAVSESPNWYLDAEILFGKIAAANWRDWPLPEQRATEGYAAAVIGRMRDDPLDASEVDQWVCAVSQFLEDVTPLLDASLLATTSAARQNLYGLYDWNRRNIEKRGSLGNAFWESSYGRGEKVMNPNVGEIVAWFRRADVSAAVDEAYAFVLSR